MNKSSSITAFLVVVTLILRTNIGMAQTEWDKYPGNPVLDLGASGTWDDSGVYSHTILFDGSEYKMWYSGHDGSNVRIGYATSADSIAWEKYPDNPVLDLGADGTWDDIHVRSPTVLFDGAEYRMWYHGYDGSNHRIGSAASADGIVWVKHPANPVLGLGASGTWDDVSVVHPTVLFDGTEYKMWYTGSGSNERIGSATSADGIAWEKYPDNPVLDLGADGTWDDYHVGSPTVLFDGTKYQMWYAAHDGSIRRIGSATSADGIVWEKYPDNPVLGLGADGTWDDNEVAAPTVLFDGTKYQMGYTGRGPDADVRIGYATSIPSLVPTVLEKVSGDNQSGVVGAKLPEPLVVLVKDQYNNPMEGVEVNFSPSEGASVNPTQAMTNENGEAQAILTLGAEPGEYTVTASVEGLDPVVFTATAIAENIPEIFNVYPGYGYISGGTEITIAGANFKDGALVTLGGRLAHDITKPEETSAWLTSDRIDITDEAPEYVQLLITLDEGIGPTTETITFSTSGISLAQIQVETTSLEVLRIIIQTAIDNRFGAGKIVVSVAGSDTGAQVTFTTEAIGEDVRLSIEQQAGSDILFSEPLTSSGLQIHAITPEGTVGAKTVVVTNPDGESATYPKGFVYLPLTGDVSGDGTISAYDAALILQFVVGLIDVFPADSPIGQAAQKFIAGEITVDELDRILQSFGYPSVFKLWFKTIDFQH